MPLTAAELNPNAHIDVGGSEGRVVQNDSSLVYVARDSGEVQVYTTESVLADASVVVPEDAPTGQTDGPVVDPTASPGQGIAPVDQTTSINIPPGQEASAAASETDAQQISDLEAKLAADDAEIADLKSQLAAAKSGTSDTPSGSITDPGSGPLSPSPSTPADSSSNPPALGV